MSRRLCKKTEGAGFPFQIEIFAFPKYTVGSSPAPDLYKAARKCGLHQGPWLPKCPRWHDRARADSRQTGLKSSSPRNRRGWPDVIFLLPQHTLAGTSARGKFPMEGDRISQVRAELTRLFDEQVEFFRRRAQQQPSPAEQREYQERRERIRQLFEELRGLRKAA
jgi:hypothetical protein